MPIYINKDGQQSGPYEDHIVTEQLGNGMLSPNDLGIRHGGTAWQKLGEMFPGVGVAAAPRAAEVAAPPVRRPAPIASAEPESQFRKTGLLKTFFGLCFL